jgi:GAF domain-containing protein
MWSMCDQAIRGEGALVIPDLSEDPRFRDSPAVTGEEHLRFYAGYPIESPDGYRVGALCVLDDRPRDPADIDTDALAELALLAQKELWRSAAG